MPVAAHAEYYSQKSYLPARYKNVILFKLVYRIYPKYSDTSTPYHICFKI